MSVKTTQTILDRQKEQKDLMLEINGLKAQKESISREVNELIEAKTALINEIHSGVKVGELKDTVLSNIRFNLQKDIDELSVKKDSLERIKDKNTELVGNLSKAKKELANEVKNKQIELKSTISELGKLILKSKEEKNQFEREVERTLADLVNLNMKRDSLNKEISESEQSFKEKQEFIKKEEIRLANKGQDLNIYEARLRAKYLELMPGVEIVI